MGKTGDTGLRGNRRGDIYIDKKVFFNRDKVKTTIKSIKGSIKQEVRKNKMVGKGSSPNDR